MGSAFSTSRYERPRKPDGKHYLQPVEQTFTATNLATFFGDGGSTFVRESFSFTGSF